MARHRGTEVVLARRNHAVDIERSNGKTDYPVQAIMSRTGSFPLIRALDLLKQFGGDSSLILDPFCGKGTTLLAARALGLRAYGMDIAPEAVVSSRAKLVDVSLENVLRFIHAMDTGGQPVETVPSSVKVFFHSSTLAQLTSIRKALARYGTSEGARECPEGAFTLAVLLGILHGHASYSLSIPSAHAFSMAPAYVAKFAREHGLEAPARDVRECLREKASRCLRIPLPRAVPYEVKRASTLDCCREFPELTGKVDIVLTSPPYLNAQTYPKDNWLRQWFLGYDYRQTQHEYLATSSIGRYGSLMSVAFAQISRMLKPGGLLICLAGDVSVKGPQRGERSTFETGAFLASVCQSPQVGLRIRYSFSEAVPSSSRYYHSLNKSNGHRSRDLVERVFVAEKPK